ncbi:Uncharacterised protein [Mycobacteroides abscessus subsp. abscessus]|nr:Uncharacterised protein [Mycobacteroides abscessus subsp. abscessus]
MAWPAGSVAPGFSALMSAWSQVVMAPLKMSMITLGVSTRLSTPFRL